MTKESQDYSTPKHLEMLYTAGVILARNGEQKPDNQGIYANFRHTNGNLECRVKGRIFPELVKKDGKGREIYDKNSIPEIKFFAGAHHITLAYQNGTYTCTKPLPGEVEILGPSGDIRLSISGLLDFMRLYVPLSLHVLGKEKQAAKKADGMSTKK
jgi:hypothetical protein